MDKISKKGMGSLTAEEREILKRESDKLNGNRPDYRISNDDEEGGLEEPTDKD